MYANSEDAVAMRDRPLLLFLPPLEPCILKSHRRVEFNSYPPQHVVSRFNRPLLGSSGS